MSTALHDIINSAAELDGLDEIALIVTLWREARTREVALELADKNRLRAAAKPRKEAA